MAAKMDEMVPVSRPTFLDCVTRHAKRYGDTPGVTYTAGRELYRFIVRYTRPDGVEVGTMAIDRLPSPGYWWSLAELNGTVFTPCPHGNYIAESGTCDLCVFQDSTPLPRLDRETWKWIAEDPEIEDI